MSILSRLGEGWKAGRRNRWVGLTSTQDRKFSNNFSVAFNSTSFDHPLIPWNVVLQMKIAASRFSAPPTPPQC